MRQRDLFDAAKAAKARDRGISRAEGGAPPDWRFRAAAAVRGLARTRQSLTTDDVWKKLQGIEAPPEPRALGAIMRAASEDGLISATDRTIASKRVKCHRRPIRVWKSNIWAV